MIFLSCVYLSLPSKNMEYAKDRRLETLEATLEVFEATPNDDEYKTTF
ncbi:MAG: hypothetical protein ACE5KE_10090 [Methanosarcinales archaeon]